MNSTELVSLQGYICSKIRRFPLWVNSRAPLENNLEGKAGLYIYRPYTTFRLYIYTCPRRAGQFFLIIPKKRRFITLPNFSLFLFLFYHVSGPSVFSPIVFCIVYTSTGRVNIIYLLCPCILTSGTYNLHGTN